jgi:hypothetical protein
MKHKPSAENMPEFTGRKVLEISKLKDVSFNKKKSIQIYNHRSGMAHK